MTSEEQALEAARVIKEEIGMSEHSIQRVAEIIDWCLTWKDAQFKEYLEKKKKDIMNNPYNGHCLSNMNLLEEIINELFKEENK